MKKPIDLALVLGSFVLAVLYCQANPRAARAAEGPIAWRENPDAALEEAQRERRPIVAYVTADFCGFCRKMDRETWADGAVADAVKRGFVPLKLEGEKHADLARRLGVRGFPTTIIFGSDGRGIISAPGFLSRKELLKLLSAPTQR